MFQSAHKKTKQDFLLVFTFLLLISLPIVTISVSSLRDERTKASDSKPVPQNLESKTAYLVLKFDSKKQKIFLVDKLAGHSAPAKKEKGNMGQNNYGVLLKNPSGATIFETSINISDKSKDSLVDLRVPFLQGSTLVILDSRGSVKLEEKLQ